MNSTKESDGLLNDDWVPADWGYISNTGAQNKNGGTTGENIIYMGGGKWWGHYLSIGSTGPHGRVIQDLDTLNKDRILPLDDWYHEVDMFDGVQDNSFHLKDYRRYTTAGLK